MNQQPIVFKNKSDLNSGQNNRLSQSRAEPTTCTDAEPYALQVLDDSMEPEFWRGAIILIDPSGRATNGSYVLAKHHDAYIFRQLVKSDNGSWSLNALALGHPTLEIEAGLKEIVGVIVQRAGTRRHQHKRY